VRRARQRSSRTPGTVPVSAAGPDPDALASDIAAAVDQPRPTPAITDAEWHFDDLSSPWYTVWEVRSPDRRGLLHGLAAAIAAAGASVHSARVATAAGRAVDRFELTDRNGRKLDRATEDAIAAALREGVGTKRRAIIPRRK